MFFYFFQGLLGCKISKCFIIVGIKNTKIYPQTTFLPSTSLHIYSIWIWSMHYPCCNHSKLVFNMFFSIYFKQIKTSLLPLVMTRFKILTGQIWAKWLWNYLFSNPISVCSTFTASLFYCKQYIDDNDSLLCISSNVGHYFFFFFKKNNLFTCVSFRGVCSKYSFVYHSFDSFFFFTFSYFQVSAK